MKLHLPLVLRTAVLAAIVGVPAICVISKAAEAVRQVVRGWPGGSNVTLSESEESVLINTDGDEVAGLKVLNVADDANYTINVQAYSSKAEAVMDGYGVLGDGSTVVTVRGESEVISNTSLNLHSFLNLGALNIDGNAVVTLAPGMFMNGDMTHDIAGIEGLEKNPGVLIGVINLGNGTLILNNGSGYLFDNGGYSELDGKIIGGEGYTLNVTHDNAYVQVGANMRTKWKLINGMTDDGVYHSLRIGGQAREFDVTEIVGMKDLLLDGGNLTFHKVENAVHGNLHVGHAATVVLNGNNMMAQGSHEFSVAGHLNIGNSTQTLTGTNVIRMNNGLVEGKLTADDLTNGLQLRAAAGTDNEIELLYSGMSNRIAADINIEGDVKFSTMSAHLTGEVRDMLELSGYLSGAGNITMAGSGMVVISNRNDAYTGSVLVSEGSSLSLDDIHALANAENLTVSKDSYLRLNTNGLFPVELRHLHLGNGATLAIENLPSGLTASASQSAISVESLTFDSEGSVNIVFDDELRTMRVYSVFMSDSPVGLAGLSEIIFYMNNSLGSRVSFEDGHYVLGSKVMEDGHHLYFVETRFGNIWNGGANNSWTADAAVWNKGEKYDGSAYDYALFFNQDGVNEATVDIKDAVDIEGIYVQNVGTDVTGSGSTKYIFKGGVDGTDIAGGTELHLRDTAVGTGVGCLGNGAVVELQNIQAGAADKSMGWVTVSVGELRLTQGSTMYYSATDMLQVGAAGDALFSIEEGSHLISSTGAMMTATPGKVASFAGVKMTGNAILGGNTAANTGISYLSDAQLNGYNVEAIELRGKGAIINGGIGADTGLSTDYNGMTSVAAGAEYTLGGHIDFNDKLVNSGTVIIADGALLDFSDLSSVGVNGNQYTFTFIDGGTVVNWDKLTLSSFQYGDVNLGEVENVLTMDKSNSGQLVLTYTDIRPISWDAGWDMQKPPVFGKTFTGQNWGDGVNGNLNLADGAINFVSNGGFQYDKIVSTAPKGNTVVLIQRDSDSDSEGNYLAGGCNWGLGYDEALTGNIWIYDEGSDYNTKIGGYKLGWNETGTPNFVGDSHLQIVGESHLTDVVVYGGSWGIRQTGNAYLSINAGGYKNIYGASSDAELNGDVHMRLNSGKINTYYTGATFSEPEGWTTVNGTTVANGEFKYDSYDDAAWVLGLSGQYTGDDIPYYELNSSASHWGGVYATGSNAASGAATEVLGKADVYLGSDFDFSTNLAVIDGGAAHVQGLSTLHLTDGVQYTNLNKEVIYAWIKAVNGFMFWDQYSESDVEGAQPFMGKFTGIEIRGFDRIELADGAFATLQSSRFNTDTDVTVAGSGTIELVRPEVFQLNYYGILQAPFCEKDSEQGRTVAIPRRNITLVDGARLKVATDYITAWNADSGFTSLIADDDKVAVSKAWSNYYDHEKNGRSDITVTVGTTLDISDWQRDSAGGNMLVDVFISGHGTDGLGALYKGISEYDRDTAAFFQFPYIEVMGN
ncbi:MAG: hypothetical protein Q4F35_05340, partial [Akkermansia sp.]|nr:hypothetical protein [Akkermansia sp.]